MKHNIGIHERHDGHPGEVRQSGVQGRSAAPARAAPPRQRGVVQPGQQRAAQHHRAERRLVDEPDGV